MIKNLLIIAFISVSLASCMSFTGATPSQQLSSVEAGYTSIVSGLNAARKPCVTGEGLCLINDDLYIKINPVLQTTQDALNTSRNFIDAGQIDQAKVWLERATLNIATLTTFLATIEAASNAAKNVIGVR